jgi:hypothetical protein
LRRSTGRWSLPTCARWPAPSQLGGGECLSPEAAAEIEAAQAARAARRQANSGVGGGIAVLPLYGVISQRASMMDDICGAGGTSTERFTQAFRDAMADDSLAASSSTSIRPGGSVFGVADLYDEIMAGARRQAGLWLRQFAVRLGGLLDRISLLAADR